MSILIKGMDMPKDCCECPLDLDFCELWKDDDCNIDIDGRHKNCPMVEVEVIND